ncbi:SH3 domain-containing protein [Pseudonocardia sp. RS11V-5]|uniref:SH3 domain-containing protein n=1 Tax=Pseudonocardia terrae TaxID=2905831 RepID=UPI001E439CD7|nr:SH3 domain-containing protein [Pseudonocardia terrae]MCE3549966.1 SH3 domain-containing protein [Pseudonocardia terrae]
MKVTGLQRPGRAAAAVGGLLAVGAAGLMAVLAGTASAATAGTCTDNVNVREEPRADAAIVAVCDRGTTVQVGETRNGFVKLENLDGWAVKDYVKTNGAASGSGTGTPSDAGVTRGGQNGSTPATTAAPSASGTDSPENATPAEGADGANADQNAPAETPARSGGVGGLLGR